MLDTIVIHCSASPNGVYISPAQVDAWHAAPPHNFHRQLSTVERFNRALPHIGYHWLITADGRHNAGRATEEIGAHVAGRNARSLGICMTGMDRFYLRQWEALARLICDLAFLWQSDYLKRAECLNYALRPAEAIAQLKKMGIAILGHRDCSPDLNGDGKITSNEWLKTCPGFSVADWLAIDMQPLAAHILDTHPAIASPTGAERAVNSY